MDQLTVISGLDRIVNQDGTNHLNCRLQQVLAFAASRCRWTDLVLYPALGSTFDIYRHCYVRRRDRWAFQPPYLRERDLRLIGVELTPVGPADPADFDGLLERTLAADRPLIFYAPRADFPHWVEFMRQAGTIPAEYRNLHSFLICGANPDRSELVVMDNARPDHDFQALLVPRQLLAEGYARDPDRWFTDLATLAVHGEPDVAGLAARYRTLVAGHRHEPQLYDHIGDGLAADRADYPETYRAPGVNALALLAGGRDFFCRFLRRTGHSREVQAAYTTNARLTRSALDRAGRYHAGEPGVSADELRRDLHLLGRREERAARLLADDLAGMDVLFPQLRI